ncbi:uncharacterized protein [Leuresthes tenuis]|uniref:uncharacterized protein n=1 Tax=Leuresthes tenuis TaxID=355514 RepID=UPI003B5030E3
MSALLREIQQINPDAASVLERADLRTDSEIQSLTREELRELFPAAESLKLRRTIFGMIHKQKPFKELFRELKHFIPNENLREALAGNGVLVDYLHILRDVKDQVNYVQGFLDAHIDFLESSSEAQPDKEPHRGTEGNWTSKGEEGSNRTMTTIDPNMSRNSVTQGASASADIKKKQPTKKVTAVRPQQTQETLKYKMVVSGITFDAHRELLDKIQGSIQSYSIKLEETQNSDYQIVIVFCPIVSRVGTDVKEAMMTVTSEKPVILVLMHHCHEAKAAISRKTWDGNHILLHVDVFYHETKRGLLDCSQNEKAAFAIRKELMTHFHPKSQIDNDIEQSMDTGPHNISPKPPSKKHSTGLFGSFF